MAAWIIEERANTDQAREGANHATPSETAFMQVQSRTAATPIAFVKAILLAYKKYGADPRAALAEAEIATNLLKHPQARITAKQMELIAGTAMRQLDDEALGWFARKLPWGSM